MLPFEFGIAGLLSSMLILVYDKAMLVTLIHNVDY
jgi:hypothetical protein